MTAGGRRVARATTAGVTAGRAAVLGGLAMFIALAGCDKLGNPLARVPPPDEFQVIAYEPPVIPPSFDSLPPPAPGTPSPRKPDPRRMAISALGGVPASPVTEAPPESPAERALLATADAAAASSEIRVQLESEQRAEKRRQPYEPPSVFELMGVVKKPKVPKGEIIDPETEAERLVAEGQPAPLDPEAAARKAAEAAPPPPEVKPQYPTGRPEHPLVGKSSAPAY